MAYYGRTETKIKLIFPTLICVIIFLFFVMFIEPYNTIICAGSYCSLYTQTGCLGFKHQYDKFKRTDVVGYRFNTLLHKRSRNTTNFRLVLIMKDSSEFKLPFRFGYYNKNKAEYIVKGIRSNKYFKKTSNW